MPPTQPYLLAANLPRCGHLTCSLLCKSNTLSALGISVVLADRIGKPPLIIPYYLDQGFPMGGGSFRGEIRAFLKYIKIFLLYNLN